MNDPLLPGDTLGIFGGGQLGRMLALAARPLGLRVAVFCDQSPACAFAVADEAVLAPYDDEKAVREFARRCGAVTYEFENIPVQTLNVCREFCPVRPDPSILEITQNRLSEKGFLRKKGYPVGTFAEVGSFDDFDKAIRDVGTPAILKTAQSGYDGKGQWGIESMERPSGWDRVPAILEARIPFERELSVVVARSCSGDGAVYPVFENRHWNHILDTTTSPAEMSDAGSRDVRQLGMDLAEDLNLEGLIAVELFQAGTKILVNEIAPRVHNSGHLTIEAAATSQFLQQVRTVSGWTPGPVDLWRPAAMANLLGDLWQNGEPNWGVLTEFPDVYLHLYGKGEGRPGRKMGHLTAPGANPDAALKRVEAARAALADRSR